MLSEHFTHKDWRTIDAMSQTASFKLRFLFLAINTIMVLISES